MTTRHDKHGTEISKGDVIEFVWGGEHHTTVAEKFSEAHGHHYVEAQITVKIPTTACSKRKDENPKDAPKDESPVSGPSTDKVGGEAANTTTTTKKGSK